jgi:predicted SPOUT superfamily RNA methylase MTH1
MACNHCDKLADEVELLRQQIKALAPSMPPLPGLSIQQNNMLAFIYKRGRATAASLNVICSWNGHVDDADPKRVCVRISQMRHWLRPWGIDIVTIRGWGYSITGTDKLTALYERLACGDPTIATEARSRGCVSTTELMRRSKRRDDTQMSFKV